MNKLKSHLNNSVALFLLVFCTSIFSINLAAIELSIDAGPVIGSQIPELVVLDSSGDPQKLSDVMGEKGAIIVLFRSADWCPFCKAHLRELNLEVLKFKKRGYLVSAISYDSPKILANFSNVEKLIFPLLSDQNFATFKALNVLNKMHQPNARHYGIPYPGVLVVNPDGKVIHKYFYEGYKNRVKFELLLKDLE